VALGLKVVGDCFWKSIGESIDRAEARLMKVVQVIESSVVPYAIVGGNAVRIYVAQVDKATVRATNVVDILIRQYHLGKIKQAMLQHGFHYRHTAGLDMFVEDESESARHAVHVVSVNQMMQPDDYEPNPGVEPAEYGDGVCPLRLEKLVRMKLNSFRLKDRVHLLDMIDNDLIDSPWPPKFPGPLGERLKHLVENPEQ
jgi:hypothetical protein